MNPTVTPIPLGSGAMSVNAYLLVTSTGFVLVDTGMKRHRGELGRRLRDEGCEPGGLGLIVITHGDIDHIGNAAHMRRTFDAPIAMHLGDMGMSRDGDMFSGRKGPNRLVRAVLSAAVRLPDADRFEPDIALEEGVDLAEYGLETTQVLALEGHSAGSIVLLLPDGDLICGDLLENRSGPKLGSIMDDVPAAKASVERLNAFDIGMVYPGHGSPFPFEELARSA